MEIVVVDLNCPVLHRVVEALTDLSIALAAGAGIPLNGLITHALRKLFVPIIGLFENVRNVMAAPRGLSGQRLSRRYS